MMHQGKSVLIAALAATLLSGVAAAGGVAGFTLAVTEKAPPSEVSEEIRGRLAPKSHVISGEDGVIFEFWFVSAIPLDDKPDSPLEALDNTDGAGLLGLVAVRCGKCSDFHDDPFDPGVYTMRLGFQPQNGDHMGTAPFDTFAILVPHDRDGEVFLEGRPDHRNLIEVSLAGTVTEHPPILGLQAAAKAEGDFPRLGEGESGWKLLCVKLPFAVGGEVVEMAVQLIYEGHGHL